MSAILNDDKIVKVINDDYTFTLNQEGVDKIVKDLKGKKRISPDGIKIIVPVEMIQQCKNIDPVDAISNIISEDCEIANYKILINAMDTVTTTRLAETDISIGPYTYKLLNKHVSVKDFSDIAKGCDYIIMSTATKILMEELDMLENSSVDGNSSELYPIYKDKHIAVSDIIPFGYVLPVLYSSIV